MPGPGLTDDTTGVKLLRVVVSLLLLGVGIICCFNAVTYSKIANTGENVGDVSPAGARALMWFNIIFAVLTIVVAIYYFWTGTVLRNVEIDRAYALLKAPKEWYSRLPENNILKRKYI
jgi:hypothetical protein